MKVALVCLSVLAACIHGSAIQPKPSAAAPEAATVDGKEEAAASPFGRPLFVQRLLRYPIGVLRIVLSDERRPPQDDLPAVPPPDPEDPTQPEADTEPATTEEEDWQELDLNGTSPFVKSLITVPTRCGDGERFAKGRCRKVFD